MPSANHLVAPAASSHHQSTRSGNERRTDNAVLHCAVRTNLFDVHTELLRCLSHSISMHSCVVKCAFFIHRVCLRVDWTVPGGYSNEAVVKTTGYRNSAGGKTTAGSFNLYEYSWQLDANQIPLSITLPNNLKVAFLAFTVLGPCADSSCKRMYYV